MVKNRLIINDILIVLLFRVILVLLVAAKDSITFCNWWPFECRIIGRLNIRMIILNW